jgi:hypothetical protein
VLASLARVALPLALAALTTVAACGALDPKAGPASAPCVDADSNPDMPVSFALTIRPWMNRSANDPVGHGCKTCHYSTASDPKGIEIGGLDLTTLASLRRGGVTSGASIVVPGRPCESALVQKLRGDYVAAPVRMPKDGPPYWPPSWIQTVSDWIAEGAQGADDE